MADATQADVTQPPTFAMAHRSPRLAFQTCQTCHTAALANGASTPTASTLWQIGAFHPSVTSQPTTCLDCHAASVPSGATQGTTTYALAQGGTTSNGAQWMSHLSSKVVGSDCVKCHAADAKTTGSTWSRANAFHTSATPALSSCQECHGLANGGGAVAGTGNNLPAGLTDSSSLSTASASDAGVTGIAAGAEIQLVHTDLNVAGHDCNFCHTQAGASTVAGVPGRSGRRRSSTRTSPRRIRC